jgi:hypothetical protein
LLATLGFCACAKKVTINGQDVANNKKLLGETPQPAATVAPPVQPQGAPVNLPNALSAPRQYSQTRGSFGLSIAAVAFAAGDTFTVTDDASGKTLLDHMPASAAITLSLTLYPLDPALAGKFVYGDNPLHLLVNDAEPKTSATTVHLNDFTVFAPATATFPAGGQRRHGLQGGFSQWRQDATSSGVSSLTTGLVPMVNR